MQWGDRVRRLAGSTTAQTRSTSAGIAGFLGRSRHRHDAFRSGRERDSVCFPGGADSNLVSRHIYHGRHPGAAHLPFLAPFWLRLILDVCRGRHSD